MALQGPRRPNFGARSPAPSGSPQVDGLGDALLQQGRTESRQVARRWAKAVVAALKERGPAADPLGAGRLRPGAPGADHPRLLQRKAGRERGQRRGAHLQKAVDLPATGRIDVKTAELAKAKVAETASATSTATPDAPEGAGRGTGAGREARVHAGARSSPQGAAEARAAATTASGTAAESASSPDRARTANDLLAQLEPERAAPAEDDFQMALRRARVRGAAVGDAGEPGEGGG